MSAAANHHASAVAFGPEGGILILGRSGAGKSRLALALIDAGAQLVADDQVLLTAQGDAVYARAPRSIAGMIEVRGLGLLTMAYRRLARLVLALDLDLPPARRLPDPEMRPLAGPLTGLSLPCLPAATDGAFPRAVAHYIRALKG
ncbi:MAG: HPr kinase/phosphatase C-terminal domain-containing protein [Rhodobacter sp.]|nr:HPr kinase/phosphatase C-terminal domain-containing protein [Paracoccaceae bacterium]MCC0078004.1 HPr kinase/phosphatase C-terminal domain-containing protein [Rhodobacter sp.]